MNGSDMLTFRCERLHFRLGIHQNTLTVIYRGITTKKILQSYKPNASNSQLLIDASDGKEVGKQIHSQLEEFRAEFSGAAVGGRHLF